MPDKPKRRKRRKKMKPDLQFTSTVPWIGRGPDDPMLIGYVRVSTDEQDTQRQVDELVKAGVHWSDIWGDKASGKDMDRQGWKNMVRELEPGDVLVVHALDRISRDALDTLTVFRDLADRGVKIRVITMGLDTTTPVGRFALTMMAAFAQMEREMILIRTMSGLQRAKERGVFLGAVKQFPDAAIAEAVKTYGTYEAAAQALGCKRITVARGMARIKAAEEVAKEPKPE
jgi:DNA invertase Pin-like site-specific DNA recombinase